jgi:phosphate uptake regulator
MPQHTDRIFETTLEQLRSAVLEMGGLVEDQIVQAVRSLIERNEELAQETIDRDHTVNRYDVEIDDLSLKLLALHQPAARGPCRSLKFRERPRLRGDRRTAPLHRVAQRRDGRLVWR